MAGSATGSQRLRCSVAPRIDALPFIAKADGAMTFCALVVVWAITSSALRAPPLMLLGKYAARPAIQNLDSLAMLGIGIAGAVSPYLA